MSYGHHDDRGSGPDRGDRKGPPDISNMFSIKVDNIPFSSEDRDLRDLFSRFGRIGDIFTPNSRHGGRAGYAFVRYYAESDAEDALRSSDGADFMGRRLRCQWARYGRGDAPPRDGPRGGPPGGGYGGPPPGYGDRRGPGGYDDRRGGGGYDDRRGPGGYDDRRGGGDRYGDRGGPPPRRDDDRRRREPPAPREPVRIPYVAPTPRNPEATVRVTGLPASITRYDVRLFAERAGPLAALDLEGGQSAWVEYMDPATAAAALRELDGGEAIAIPVQPEDRSEKARVAVGPYTGPAPPAPAADGAAGGEQPPAGGEGGDAPGPEAGEAAAMDGGAEEPAASSSSAPVEEAGPESGAGGGEAPGVVEGGEGEVEVAEDLTA